MDIRHLSAFIAVFEERNITLAAQRLCTSQPSLSVTIRQLEQELGTQLFIRQPRGVEISDDARVLYPQARRMVAQAQVLSRQFRQRDDRLPLILGVEADIGTEHIAAFLRLAYAGVPQLQLKLQAGCGGDARLAVEELCCEDELFLPIWDEPFVLSLPREHRLADKPTLTADDLTGLDWITCPLHAAHQRLMNLYNNSTHCAAAEADSLYLAQQLVAAGVGGALLPRTLAAHPDIISRALSMPLPSRRVGLCYAAQALENPALRALHEHLQMSAANSRDNTHAQP
ncbi:MAG: LysR family transcriptional regulator [Pseudomonadaceae bacterium]|nr:LysR family transcriptional regulator [Pseudomonadaceae bacterium]